VELGVRVKKELPRGILDQAEVDADEAEPETAVDADNQQE
jgi:DNA recombination protein RmuC